MNDTFNSFQSEGGRWHDRDGKFITRPRRDRECKARTCNFGGGGVQTTNQTFKPPDFTQSPTNPFWSDYVKAGSQLAQQPYQQYQGMTVAPLNSMQNAGLQFTADRALNGAPDLNAGRAQAMNTANGAYLNTNPYASNQYTDKVIGNNASNMALAYANGTAAQTDAMYARNGGFGGSAWQQQQSMNALGLSRSVGQMADQTRQNQTNLAAGLYGDERNRQLQASQLAGTLSQDDWMAGKSLTGAGDAYSAYTQKLFDASQGAFNQQQQHPWQMLDNMGNVLSRASGTGNQGTVQQQLPGMSGVGGTLGLLGLLAGGARLAGT